MEISGKIIVKLPLQSGVSKSGNEWKKQEYVLETKDKYPKKIAFSVMNENISRLGLDIGQDVDLYIDIDAREYNGKWYNSIVCYKAILRNPVINEPASSQGAAVYYNNEKSAAVPLNQGGDLPF